MIWRIIHDSMDDRTQFVPRHSGRNVLPCTPLFSRLLRLAHRSSKVAIRDCRANVTRTHVQLLSDVLALRETLINSLDHRTREALDNGEDVYIAVLALGSYEYAVAVLAVLAAGAAAVPLTTALPVDEAVYFVKKSGSVAILAHSNAMELGQRLEAKIVQEGDPKFQCIPIQPALFSTTIDPFDILVSSDLYLDENGPGIVIFTSGTTGPPKGAVMRRSYVFDGAIAVAEHYALTEADVMLHVLPVHHATGVGITFFPFLVSGCTIEFRSGSFDEKWLWDRWREGARDPQRRLTFFSGVPTIYMRMRRYYQRVLSKLAPAHLAEYVAGARQFRACLCGTSALPYPINQFWMELMQKKIVQRYGATEFGAIFKVRLGSADEVPEGSVGERVPGIDIKLSDGDEGEVLVKSPHMFSKYLGDPEATAKAHDKEGYFRTGDLARRQGKHYFIIGRASMDIIKSGGYKISALDIEREILALPYVSEIMVVGVEDIEFGQRVAALIALQEEEISEEFLKTHGDGKKVELTIDNLRRDLRDRLAGYKMPTLLRIVKGDFPKTASGKVLKKLLGPRFFPPNYLETPEVQVWKSSKPPDNLAKL
ncbi:fatty-acyl-CoA synthase [Eremomyces bilateralis CBS 781.70]|uniref:Fatty-acyl-CoA synthase n=1 Tax=Eremomyces bilateralis CBS 781.70 TaxID=1392243 RepID=A0A6G1FUJ4_9PEZI|nr:fatty-acyl-CoA synthase [Eremomyces bilateralis CBS 781.70]KAF1809368.1 fatty-acyl-CoA synthase [Eremomyces bilateralis CBS 781.70]